ncbi:PD-(D/E)XK nuclease family protein [Aureliella helgolandensis]|uniref:AAA+ ATPase domain-containing protein n=1 Tax=Aureliella helgolandensis TaxID=2527968 RepID=A0A518G483_9BACT|nr:PD-(D/E)XK nuclease family protein [Aureliella helgolandensis]QDV23359.1 hypothetical protein Q31a_16570 [Aureliella helgolandensis]
MSTTISPQSEMTNFVRHLQFSSPFAVNRVSEAGSQLPSHHVEAIHADEYEEILHLVKRAKRADGIGAILWGEPGVGKSHLIARLASQLQKDACVTFLHNVQVRAERLPRYVLKTILSQLARSRNGGLHGGKLNMLMAATVERARGTVPKSTLATVYQSYRNVYIKPAIESGNSDQEIIYEMLFAYFLAIYRGRKNDNSSPQAAELALRWLTGDNLDREEVRAIGLPEDVAQRVAPLIPDDQGVEAVIAAIANLAAQANMTFVMFFDQVDNLNEEQVSAWARFAHGMIDHISNLLVVTSGVRGRILELQQSTVVNTASWDRIAQIRIEIGRISPIQAEQLIAVRLDSFLAPFADLPQIQELTAMDRLFPLGRRWLSGRIGNALELRPRDVINWAQERVRSLAGEIKSTSPEEWLAAWPASSLSLSEEKHLSEPQAPLTCEKRMQLIDSKIEGKLIEQSRRRKLDPETLPADAENLLGLTEQLLAQCVAEEYGYSLQNFERLSASNRTGTPAYDLLVEEKTPDGELRTTGIKFLGTGSKSSTAVALRRMLEDPHPPQHTLVVTEERLPLKIGPKGEEYLNGLRLRGENAFGLRQLSFGAHVQLDALQSLVGLAQSGDIEVTLPDGNTQPIDVDQVIESHHRVDRYRNHALLGELLTEECLPTLKPTSDTEEDQSLRLQLEQFLLGELSLTNGATTSELADKYVTGQGLDSDQTDHILDHIEQAALALHRSGQLVATPQDNLTFVSLPRTADEPAPFPSGQLPSTLPVHFSVTQVRQAAACARLLHLDASATRSQNLKKPRITRIWQFDDSSETSALGTLFHRAVEKFNDSAHRSPDLYKILEARPSVPALGRELQRLIQYYVNNAHLMKAQPQELENFRQALSAYSLEVAHVLNLGMQRQPALNSLLAEVFGDRRRDVDVTFHVGPNAREVHITGKLDYVFYDWRRDSRRIIDYKLTPGKSIEADLFQVCVYALMHHQQHGTQPDVALLYLHPERKMVELTWEQVHARRHEIYDLLSSMVDWQNFDPQSQQGMHPPGNASYCLSCRYKDVCTTRLGPTETGDQQTLWRDQIAKGNLAEPIVERHQPNRAEETQQGHESSVPCCETQIEPAKWRPAPTTEKRTPESLPTYSDAANFATDGDSAVPPPECKPLIPHSHVPAETLTSTDLRLGQTASGVTVNLPLKVLPSHVALVGAAGSGKTWMAKVIVEEAVRQGVPILAIDPQGDLVQFLHATQDSSRIPADELAEFRNRVEPRIYTPGSSHATRLSIDPIRFPSEIELASISNPLRRSEERDGMLSSTISNLISLANAGGDADLQRTFLMRLIKLMLVQCDGQGAELALKDLAHAVNSPADVGMEDPDCYLPKSQRTRLGRKLRTLFDGPRAKLFREGTPLNIDDFCKPTQTGKTPLNVIYLNALANDEEKQFFVASLATELYRWMVTAPSNNGQAKLLVYLDEARDFAPAGSSKPPAKDPLIRLFAQGRKFGVSGLICTQSPRSVDYQIFSNCSTKFIGRLESSQDVERVKEWFGKDGGSPAWLAGRKSAARGTFIGRWPDIRPELDGQAFKGRPLYSLHEGAWSPDQVENAVRNS